MMERSDIHNYSFDIRNSSFLELLGGQVGNFSKSGRI